MDDEREGRRYRKRKRARQEAATRRRITEAVVALHRTVGPVNTTVTAVAERAGVSRVTVYNHFPLEADLVEACSAHWAERNPFPDPEPWRAIADPPQRARTALADLYGWYRRTEDMMGKVLRDAPLVPPLGAVVDARWRPWLEGVVDLLAAGWPREAHPAGRGGAEPVDAAEIRAAAALAADFSTWRLLTGQGLDDQAAAALAARMIGAAARRDGAGEARRAPEGG